MKNIFVIIVMIASFLSLKTAMHIGSKSHNHYYNSLNKGSDSDNDPRNSCPCPDSPMESCPCDTIRTNGEDIEESCTCPINDYHCSCIVLQSSRKRTETDKVDKNSNLFLQNLWNQVVNDVGESVTLYLLRKED